MKFRWIVIGLLSALALAIFFGTGEPRQLPGGPYHHTTAGFRNLPGSPVRGGWGDRVPFVFKQLLSFSQAAEAAPAFTHMLSRAQSLGQLEAVGRNDSVTWIGHMTTLVRLDGATILTDPWFSDYPSPVPPIGPKRYVPPAFAIEDLPDIDVVIVSHAHYDHLDLPTIEQLPNKERITAVVPLEIGRYFRERGYPHVVELDWEETTRVDGLKITALPVVHWSKRSVLKSNDTLWAAFSLESRSGAKVYFGGDAEHSPVYSQLSERWGGFDLAILSIGAFLPRGMMNGAHCEPKNCLRIGMDLDAHTHLGIHWGTVQLGLDRWNEAPEQFRSAGRAAGLPDEQVWLMSIGETRLLPTRR